jgi:hypothetical protein
MRILLGARTRAGIDAQVPFRLRLRRRRVLEGGGLVGFSVADNHIGRDDDREVQVYV